MPLSDQEKIQYLANVLHVAFADGSLSPRESVTLDEVRKTIDAKKSLLASAQTAVESGRYTFVQIGSFADQVKNLEDMLFVALTDADLDTNESRLAGEFAGLIGLSQQQLDQLISQMSRRCDSANYEMRCPSCSTSVPTEARFCPTCGRQLGSLDAAAVQVALEIPRAGYAIEFCDSTAAGFTTALAVASATGTIQTATKNKRTWYLATFPGNRFADMVPLASSLAGMRNRRVYVDGQEAAWNDVFGFVSCASHRATAYRPIEYCFGKDDNRLNPWGCRQTRMEWTDWAQWFSYGRWHQVGHLRSGYVFVFDKNRIHHELTTNLHGHRFCPYLRMKLVEAVLRHLPDQVAVAPDGRWKYSRAYEALPETIKVIEREGTGDFAFTSEYYSDGVRPRGCTVLAEILKRAFDECGVTDVAVGALLPK
jgi:uncharacterized tellurite resistance protein B-like protein